MFLCINDRARVCVGMCTQAWTCYGLPPAGSTVPQNGARPSALRCFRAAQVLHLRVTGRWPLHSVPWPWRACPTPCKITYRRTERENEFAPGKGHGEQCLSWAQHPKSAGVKMKGSFSGQGLNPLGLPVPCLGNSYCP